MDRFPVAEHHNAMGFVVGDLELGDEIDVGEGVECSELSDQFVISLEGNQLVSAAGGLLQDHVFDE